MIIHFFQRELNYYPRYLKSLERLSILSKHDKIIIRFIQRGLNYYPYYSKDLK